MAGTYKTSGRERLVHFLSEHPDTPYTVDELAELLRPAGKSSLYRQLSELIADGTVRRDRDDLCEEDGRPPAAVYRYIGRADCARHFHLRCMSCGRLLHLDCHLTADLLSHIQSDHHFLVNMGKSVLYGECESCAGENGENRENGETLKKLF